MLVLSRKVGERICIGEGVYVQVVDIRGGKVRLGVTAPPGVRVDREEVRLRILDEQSEGGERAHGS